MTFGQLKRGTALARTTMIAALGFLPAAAMAGEVSLKSSDGTVNLTGEFVEFVDDNYVIRTALGDLRISAARVRCEGASCPVFETTTADMIFAGSDTVGLGMMPLVLSGYAAFLDAEASIKATSNEGEIIADFVGDGGFGDEIGTYLVTSTSSGDAFKALLEESAQFGMSSRRIKPSEARELKAAGAGNMVSPSQEHIIAVDSLVIITHPENPATTITMDQIAGIYSGRITNWSELGGEDAPIKVINRKEGSGTRGVFFSSVFGDDADSVPQIGTVADDNNQVAAMVNADPHAIGFAGYAFQRGAKPLTLINSCGIATTPDAFSAKTEEYPLQRRLYLYNRAEETNQASVDFINYVTSDEADGVIAKSGFIDLGVKSQPMTLDSARARNLLDPNVDAFEGAHMREMLGQMINYERLSTTFRFRTGSSRLDERAAVDMKRLTDYLAKQPEGIKIMVVGFTDSVGAFESNRALSISRAQQVVQALSEFAGDRLAGVEMSATGFGEISPAACNTDDRGKAINRRVEVWVQGPVNG